MCVFSVLPNKCLILSPLLTPHTILTHTGLMHRSEHGPHQKALPHPPMRMLGKPPISAPTLCLPPAQCMEKGRCSAQGYPCPSSPQAGTGSLTCSSIQGSPFSVSHLPPPHHVIHGKRHTCSRVSCNKHPVPTISLPVPSSQPIFLLPFTAEHVERMVCSPCLLFLTGCSGPAARAVHMQPQLGAGGLWSMASAQEEEGRAALTERKRP